MPDKESPKPTGKQKRSAEKKTVHQRVKKQLKTSIRKRIEEIEEQRAFDKEWEA
ncbi:hypothetical protein [uncultured Vibrio sp.]|uniref:hypothetical protein n=1 Tax=uncultured Vibrio sp. TaxID=114054 RepID=UPI00262E1EDF|nr:hypothetical protein [uncultured Vibrio sp.]